MNIDPALKMHRGGEKDPQGRPYIEKYLLRKVWTAVRFVVLVLSPLSGV